MSHRVELIHRTKGWKPGQTSMTLWLGVMALPNAQEIQDLAQSVAEAILNGALAKARADGIDLLILTARVDLDLTVQKDVTAKGSKP